MALRERPLKHNLKGTNTRVIAVPAKTTREDPMRGQNRGYPTSREVALKQQVKDLIQKLGEAIHETVSDSDQISGVVREIREQGFDVLLMLEATIGLNEVDDDDKVVDTEEVGNSEDGPFTRNDLTFLKSLRITTEEHTGGGESTSD